MNEDSMPQRGPDPLEIAHGVCTNENDILPVEEHELIDVSAFNFDDEERWLYVSSQHSGDSAIQDLRAWLRGEFDQDSIESDTAAKPSIDTRTFTRPKKRSSRMSFESIMETLRSTPTSLWKLPNSYHDLQMNQNPIVPPRRETIPAMLRLNSAFTNSVLPENSAGQESLEAFLDKSQSKGIDSFINMTEPEFSDELMSISQPSDMNSSILSVAQTDKDFSSLEDSQILTESMMKTSMFEASNFGKFEDTFLTNKSVDCDKTLCNKIKHDPMKKIMNATFDAHSENPVLSISKNSLPLRLEKFDLNCTSSTIVENQPLNTSSDVYKTYDIRKERGKSIGGFNDSYRTYSVKDKSQNRRDIRGSNYLNDTYRARDLDDSHFMNGLSDQFQDLNIMNNTYIGRDVPEETSRANRMINCLSDRYQASNLSLINQNRDLNSHNDTFRDPKCLNDTYCERNSLSERSQVSGVPNCLNDTYQAQNVQVKGPLRGFNDSHDEIHQESTCLNDTYRTESLRTEPSQALRVTNRLNDTYKDWNSPKRKETVPGRKSLSTLNDTYSNSNAMADGNRGMLSKCLNNTYRAETQDFQELENDLSHVVDENRALNNLPKQQIMEHLEFTPENLMNATFNGPMSLRRELLEEVQRSSAKTSEHIPNRFNTYRKSPSRTQKSPNSGSTNLLVESEKLENLVVEDTLSCDTVGTRKLSTEENVFKVPQEEPKISKITNQSAKTSATLDTMSNEGKQQMNSLFAKSSRKLRSPRVLSKLPQFLQKSNPNLKSLPMTKTHSGLTYVKGSQPNLAFPMGRTKSGSEQRLMDVTRTTDDFLKKAAGSTESIESTQSAHSAPDLDDRLSVCSDSSHNSYSVRGMNIEQLQNIARMQEESLKQISTPKLNKRILENAWIAPGKDKNLPSPIRKISTERMVGENISPDNMGLTPKTSSPIYSPEGSSQSLHTAGIQLNNQTCIIPSHNIDEASNKKVEVPQPPKTTVPAESKSRLRQPTNWSSSSRPTGIPRPTMRLVTRPVTKTNLDLRKGF
ncbi:uncharacterized protein LOC107271824 [Cephus cinctus]|uniref:Uncharacterized protein LOC107271824 n=1 Tax=Cephus cinctus TaxID=211228 RepID=A0AAJ7FQW3_CEPCN|nr:uncharacterized protein LOC107271824 [Cephus cinctus]